MNAVIALARARGLVLLIAGMAGCGTLGKGDPLGTDGGGRSVKTVVANRTLNVSPSVQIPLEGLLLGAAAYWYVDPLAPTWQVAETRLADDRYRISLRRKPVHNGGDGEAHAIFHRRAEQLARDVGRSGYVILEYATGMDSQWPFPERVASGVVLLR